MKSTFQRNIPNMRGKRTYTFPCLCCGAIDLRGQYDARLAEKEMRLRDFLDFVLIAQPWEVPGDE